MTSRRKGQWPECLTLWSHPNTTKTLAPGPVAVDAIVLQIDGQPLQGRVTCTATQLGGTNEVNGKTTWVGGGAWTVLILILCNHSGGLFNVASPTSEGPVDLSIARIDRRFVIVH